MNRALSGFVLVLSAALLVPELAAQPGGTLKLGEKFEGELKEMAPYYLVGVQGYHAAFPIMLKAGQDIRISATVVGKGRRLALLLYDPKGVLIGVPQKGIATTWPVKAYQYTHEEVNSTGKYLIHVYSDRAGPFTLRAIVPGDASEVKALEKRREQLRQELEDIDRKLRSLKAVGSSQLKNVIEKK